MKFFTKTIIALSTALILFSCSSDDNSTTSNQPPTIKLGTPTDHQEYKFGEVIKMQALLSDEVALSSYKIDIHSASGHSHKSANNENISSSAENVNNAENAWSYTSIGDLNGTKEQLLELSIPLPAEEANYKEGHYHFGLIVINKNGKEAKTYIEIVLGEDDHH